MARTSRTRLQVLTANRLHGGEVIYANPGGWTENFAEAEVLETAEAAAARLLAARAEISACRIVEPYLFDVQEADGGFRPVSVRESIRARGPSVRPDMSRQA